jgi:hypothetical protein
MAKLYKSARSAKSATSPGASGAGPKKQSKWSQIRATYRMTKEVEPRIGLMLLSVFLAAALVTTGIFLLLPIHWIFAITTGVPAGLLATLIVFGRRAQKAAFSRIEGQPGAAAAALGMLRKGWRVDPGVAFNRNQDLVHRVVGPPGIVLVGEGNPNRLKGLLATERRKHERVAAEVKISEVIAGDGAGAVPVSKLVRHVTKLKRHLRPAEMTGVLARLKALDATRSNVPLPKGPMPTSLKGARQNMRGR